VRVAVLAEGPLDQVSLLNPTVDGWQISPCVEFGTCPPGTFGAVLDGCGCVVAVSRGVQIARRQWSFYKVLEEEECPGSGSARRIEIQEEFDANWPYPYEVLIEIAPNTSIFFAPFEYARRICSISCVCCDGICEEGPCNPLP
jgi:hypothetical protein